MTMTMPRIIDCSMMNCAYNTDNMCHAMAITVGSLTPMCDTYLQRTKKGGAMDMTGSVGACRLDNCSFNKSLECTAEGIHVGMHSDHAECETFKAR
jgi:Domain of Unknown Function (DUF1540)